MPRGTVPGLAVSVALLLSACAGAPEVQYYQLGPGTSAEVANGGERGPHFRADRRAGLRIGVRPFRVDPPYDQERIVYRIGSEPHRVGYYAYHRWAVPLERMLALVTARLLEAGEGVALAEPVAAAAGDGRYDRIVEGRLLRLEEIDLPGEERARAEIELRVLDPLGGELWRGRFEGTASSDVTEVPQVVALMEEALTEALRRAAEEGLASGRTPAER